MRPILCGKINEEHIFKLLKTIDLNDINQQTYDLIIIQILNYMNINFDDLQATVTEIDTCIEMLRLDRRTCAKLTFNSNKLENSENEIISIFQTIKNENKNIEEIIIEPSHFDLIYYKEEGEFKFHKDTISIVTPGDDYHLYSILIGLVDTSEGGETLIVNPDCQKILKFPESATRNGYIMFPSSEKHAGGKIISGKKLCFKFDAWIKFKTHQTQVAKNKPSKDLIRLKLLIKSIYQKMPHIYDLIYKKYRIIMSYSLPNRSIINSDIIIVSKYFDYYFNNNISYEGDDEEDVNKIIESRENLFQLLTSKGFDIMENGHPIWEENYYEEDEDDDYYCNGYGYD